MKNKKITSDNVFSAKHRLSLRKKLAKLRMETSFAKARLEKFESLTNREKQIIALLMLGLNNPQIAERLFISRHTVEQHRKNINRKLEIKSYADLFKFGYAFDMLTIF